MSYPIYRFNTLPSVEHPFTSTQEQTIKYLGNRTRVKEQYATLNLFIESNEQAQALYQFWKVDCENGTSPFMIPLPHFGVDYDRSHADLTARFVEDLEMQKVDKHWKSSVKIEIISIQTLYPSNTLYPSTSLNPI